MMKAVSIGWVSGNRWPAPAMFLTLARSGAADLQPLAMGRRCDVVVRTLDDQHRHQRRKRDLLLLHPEQQQSVHAISVSDRERPCDGSAGAVSADPGVLDADVTENVDGAFDALVDARGCSGRADPHDVETGFLDQIVRDDAQTVCLQIAFGEQHQRDGAVALHRERDGTAGRLEDLRVGHRRVLSEGKAGCHERSGGNQVRR